ncbi:S1 family peptidase [Nitrosomonas ureae]|uniref:Trypsin-like peptidase domain-containing protein n=1 Tax=Nitrosomonas ureae TaxID=44577 RepID=A0A286AB48_9PROT|nr:serine protease [Nitrosomonas ureae]SOD19114.1 Trypsin-like peptidase domain-containing protein [Nitrosomonas ureae]
MSANAMPIEHALVRSTVRLLAGPQGGAATSTGTGFFYQATHPTTNMAKVLIVTNKHVVKGADVVHFVLSSAPAVAALDGQHQPLGRKDQTIVWPLAGNLLSHPDPDIDLCGIDVTIPAGMLIQAGSQLRSMFINSSWLPQEADKVGIRDIEQVLVVGYPKGLWDDHNNMPIARTGTTATHPLAHYQGKKNFLVDVAAFSGSSGSPVFSYETPMYRTRDGSYTPGTKVQFVGIVWGVIEASTSGELKVVEIPSALTSVPVLNTSLNLAIALHAEIIKDLDELVFPGITRSAAH